MKITFASDYSRKVAYEEYPLQVYCYGNFPIIHCDYYEQEGCCNSCSFAKSKGERDCGKEQAVDKSLTGSYSPLFSSPSHSFKNGLERFIAKWGEKWKK